MPVMIVSPAVTSCFGNLYPVEAISKHWPERIQWRDPWVTFHSAAFASISPCLGREGPGLGTFQNFTLPIIVTIVCGGLGSTFYSPSYFSHN